ncbi:organic cation transporter protein-like isoform X2 [Panulirus ornatus]
MYDYNYTAVVEVGYEASVRNVSALRDGNGALVKCSSRTFNYTQYKSTIVTEWDLVCDRRVIYSTTQAAVQGGILLGSLIFGYLIDRWGRRPVVLLCSVFNIATAFLSAASPTVEVYIFLKVMISLSGSGQYLALFVYAMETCAAKYRAAVGTLIVIPWSLGYMVVPLIAYLVRPWKFLQIAYSIPGLSAIIYFWWLPESPRWLIIRGRNQEALKIITWAAKVNRKVLPPDHIVLPAMEKIGCQTALENSKSATETGNSILSCATSLLKQIFSLYTLPQFRVRTLAIQFCWFAAALVYYGVALGSTNLSTGLYLYVFLGGLLEIPTYLLLWPALVFIGRKKTLVALYLVCSISIMLVMILMIFYPTGTKGIVVFLAQTGKIAVTAAFELVWIFATELYPTEYRSLAMGEANIFAKLGSICSPYINDILGEYIVWTPSALFGLVSLVAAALTLLLPETGHVNMPEINDFIKKDEGVKDIDMDNINQGITNATFVSDTPRMEQPQVSSAK